MVSSVECGILGMCEGMDANGDSLKPTKTRVCQLPENRRVLVGDECGMMGCFCGSWPCAGIKQLGRLGLQALHRSCQAVEPVARAGGGCSENRASRRLGFPS